MSTSRKANRTIATTVVFVIAGTSLALTADRGRRIREFLTFADLEGDVRQAHIHIGHPQNQGGHRALAV